MRGISLMVGFFWLSVASAQLYVGGGYSYQSGAYRAINSLVAKYNTYRSQQLDQLDALSELHGPSLAVGLGMKGKAINVDVGFYGSQLDAARFDQGERVITQLDLNQTQIALAFGAFPEPGDQFALGLNMGLVYAYTTLDLSSTDPAIGIYRDERVDAYHSLGILPALQTYVGLTEHLFFYFKPSYLIDLFDNDTYTVHKALNPTQYQNDQQEDFTGRFSGLQLQGGLVFSFSGN